VLGASYSRIYLPRTPYIVEGVTFFRRALMDLASWLDVPFVLALNRLATCVLRQQPAPVAGGTLPAAWRRIDCGGSGGIADDDRVRGQLTLSGR
jgi:hypothetical protein